jgi:hypothetical protein
VRKEKLLADQKRSMVTATTLRPAEREQLDQYAASRGVTVSDHLRRLILRDLRRKALAS